MAHCIRIADYPLPLVVLTAHPIVLGSIEIPVMDEPMYIVRDPGAPLLYELVTPDGVRHEEITGSWHTKKKAIKRWEYYHMTYDNVILVVSPEVAAFIVKHQLFSNCGIAVPANNNLVFYRL